MDNKSLNIVYSSDLRIDDDSLLATLSLYYDKIYLPHAYDIDSSCESLLYSRLSSSGKDEIEYSWKWHEQWKKKWHLLFEEGVIEFLPPPFTKNNIPKDIDYLVHEKMGTHGKYFSNSDVYTGKIALVIHALYAKTSDPEYLVHRPSDTSTAHLTNVLAESLLMHELSCIREMNAEDILIMRKDTKVYKSEFIYYLNQMVDDVENRLKDVNCDEREAAKRTAERKILPELAEYVNLKKASIEKPLLRMLRNAADAAGSLLGVCITPWNYKNYIGISKVALNIADSSINNKVEAAKNKHRAFQFLASIKTPKK